MTTLNPALGMLKLEDTTLYELKTEFILRDSKLNQLIERCNTKRDLMEVIYSRDFCEDNLRVNPYGIGFIQIMFASVE